MKRVFELVTKTIKDASEHVKKHDGNFGRKQEHTSDLNNKLSDEMNDSCILAS